MRNELPAIYLDSPYNKRRKALEPSQFPLLLVEPELILIEKEDKTIMRRTTDCYQAGEKVAPDESWSCILLSRLTTGKIHYLFYQYS